MSNRPIVAYELGVVGIGTSLQVFVLGAAPFGLFLGMGQFESFSFPIRVASSAAFVLVGFQAFNPSSISSHPGAELHTVLPLIVFEAIICIRIPQGGVGDGDSQRSTSGGIPVASDPLLIGLIGVPFRRPVLGQPAGRAILLATVPVLPGRKGAGVGSYFGAGLNKLMFTSVVLGFLLMVGVFPDSNLVPLAQRWSDGVLVVESTIGID